jgi:glyoxylase-like metal-dependent hydrolase (beta-lactamase superfamily II)/rhodanese-related sulfurtransferase
MKIEQLYTGCLAEAAYYIESNGEAAVIDPLRDPQPYLDLAKRDNAKIKYVFETHFHADFVSGHLDLAKKTGATIVYGPGATADFDFHEAKDGEEFKIGNVTIVALHTPGHTTESTTYLLKDEQGRNHAIFTGDTLFLGDVGRPDLAVKSDLSQKDLAGMLYDSLRNKIMPLEDDIIVYPGHGAGSACGKKMSDETVDTLGHQKRTNYALQPMSREEFIKEVLTGLTAPPKYFPKNAVLNKKGYDSYEEVFNRGYQALSVDEFEKTAKDKRALIIDTRALEDMPKGYVKNSMWIGIDGQFAPWLGALVEDLNQPILIVADPGREEEVIMRMARVGYDNPLGYLDGGFDAWIKAGKPIETIEEITPEDFANLFKTNPNLKVLDVRNIGEFDTQHIEGAINIPLKDLQDRLNELDKNEKYYIHCAGGYRSLIAASILRKEGFNSIVNIKGGFNALKETDINLSEYHEPISEL